VLFFVSVGMLFDPSILWRHPLGVLSVLAVILVGKSLAAFAIVLAFAYPVATALTISASLAQIGEFSFILAGLGVTLGLLAPEARDLILAGALLSITLSPLVFATVGRIGAWLRDRPKLVALLERANGKELATLPQTDQAGLTGHAVIVGYGRVGSVVGSGLRSQGLAVVVVEQNRRAVEELRSRGVAAIYGNASTPGVLEAARIDHARLVVIASPEELETRRIIELAREKNAAIDIAVRTHSDSELAHLEQQQVGIAIMGERELAFGLLGYALRSLGIPKDQARQIVQRARRQDDADGSGRRPEAPAGAAPELRPHREPDVGPVG